MSSEQRVEVAALLRRHASKVLGGGCLLAACSFPDYGFAPEPGTAGSGSAGGTGGVASGGAAGDGTAASSAAGDGAAGDGDAGSSGGAAGSAGAGGQAPAAAPRCQALLEADPSLASGAYAIDPDGDGPLEAFDAYCDMQTHGGGWTLIGSFSHTSFDATTMGTASQPCYESPCVNRAYSTLPLETDLRIDAADAAIAGSAVDATAVFFDIDPSSSGHTLRSIFTGAAPAFVEGPATTVQVEWFNGLDCGSWANYGGGLCETGVHVVFKIPSGCPDGPTFVLGVAGDWSGTSSFCAGWPQLPGTDFPNAIRIWAR